MRFRPPQGAVVAPLLFALAGCASTSDYARERAASDFGCSEGQVDVAAYGEGRAQYHALGCGRQATYVCMRAAAPLYRYGRAQCVRTGNVEPTEPRYSPMDADRAPRARGPSFDREAARRALLPAVATAAGDCRDRSGPRGDAHARVTFAPTGEVRSVSLDERFDGSDVNACIASHLGETTVAPFDGDAETVAVHFAVPAPPP